MPSSSVDEISLLQLFDPPAKPFAVRLGKTFRSEKRGDQFFLIAADQFDLAASVLFFASVSAFGVEWNKISPCNISG